MGNLSIVQLTMNVRLVPLNAKLVKTQLRTVYKAKDALKVTISIIQPMLVLMFAEMGFTKILFQAIVKLVLEDV